jgi:molybdopterin-guanine dinucleotide biosynthesis protein A
MPAIRSTIRAMAFKKSLPPGVILAGGRGLRMGGRDKALIPLGDRPLLLHVADRLEPQVSQLAVNSNAEPVEIPSPLPIIADSIEDRPGPLAGILAAMDWARAFKSDWVITVAIDTPFLPKNLVERLVRAQMTSRSPVVLAETADGMQPVAGLWYTELAPSLRGSIESGTRKVTDFAEAKDAVTAFFPEDDFFNINTPEDLEIAEARLAAG